MIEFFDSLNLSNTMISSLKRYIGQTILEFDQITDQQRHLLYKMANERQKIDQLAFICTHNSQRSYLS